MIDGYNRHPAAATVQVVEATDGAGKTGAPIEVPADPQGFFTIQGLQTGKRYQVTARARDGGRVLTGSITATPPDPRVLVRVLEDYAAPTPRPGGEKPSHGSDHAADPLLGGPQNADKGSNDSKGGTETNRQAPSSQSSTTPAAEIRSEVRPENIATKNTPRSEIPVIVPRWAPAERQLPPPEAPPRRETGPAQVPSCVLTGDTLHNLALNDLTGKPWEFRHHTGKLVLLDFFGTWCVPCIQAFPHLNILHDRYGSAGLEIVGIAYEEGTPLEQLATVNRVRVHRNIDYRLLLGGGRNKPCPVRQQFAVKRFPTLVLLDDSGKIVWSAEGDEAGQFQELEIILQQRLGGR